MLASIAVAAALIAAVTAAGGLVLEAFLGVEFLFACAENEFLAAVLAYESKVIKKISLQIKKISGAEPKINSTLRYYTTLKKKIKQ